MKKSLFVLFGMAFLLYSCEKNPDIDNNTMLDGDKIFDASLLNPEKYLASIYLDSASQQQLNTPVIIAAHGFSATTFEWDELRAYPGSDTTFYVSQVLLGGHGRTYNDFKSASWIDWQSSIREEYQKLSDMGFKKIYLAGSSTGCPLIINMIKSGFFNNLTKPKGIFLIDPIIISANKTLTLVSVLGPILGYITTELDSGEAGKWYVYRPQEALKELMNLTDLTRKDLEDGITLPEGTYMKVYKSIGDEVADPVSALLIYKGIRTSSGGKIDVAMVDSKLHVFTRLKGRNTYTAEDASLQMKTFEEMKSKMTN